MRIWFNMNFINKISISHIYKFKMILLTRQNNWNKEYIVLKLTNTFYNKEITFCSNKANNIKTRYQIKF